MLLHTLKINYNIVETQLLYTHVIHFIVIFTLRGLEPSALLLCFHFLHAAGCTKPTSQPN